MPSIQPPQARDIYSTMRDMHWSPKEKAIARRAFDRALQRELEATIREAKLLCEAGAGCAEQPQATYD